MGCFGSLGGVSLGVSHRVEATAPNFALIVQDAPLDKGIIVSKMGFTDYANFEARGRQGHRACRPQKAAGR